MASQFIPAPNINFCYAFLVCAACACPGALLSSALAFYLVAELRLEVPADEPFPRPRDSTSLLLPPGHAGSECWLRKARTASARESGQFGLHT